MTVLTADQAVDRLMHCSQTDLYESVQEMHKDVYGTCGRHMFSYTVPELVNWWISHYDFNVAMQCWTPPTPFEYDEHTTLADIAYYDSCEREERERAEGFVTVADDVRARDPEDRYSALEVTLDRRYDGARY